MSVDAADADDVDPQAISTKAANHDAAARGIRLYATKVIIAV
jgi:hypothetical protein